MGSFRECCATDIQTEENARKFFRRHIEENLDPAIKNAEKELAKALDDARKELGLIGSDESLTSGELTRRRQNLLEKSELARFWSSTLAARQQRKKNFIDKWGKVIDELCEAVGECKRSFEAGERCSEIAPQCCQEDDPRFQQQLSLQSLGANREDPVNANLQVDQDDNPFLNSPPQGSMDVDLSSDPPVTPEQANTGSTTSSQPSGFVPTADVDQQAPAGFKPENLNRQDLPPENLGTSEPLFPTFPFEIDLSESNNVFAKPSGDGLSAPTSGSQSNNQNAFIGATILGNGNLTPVSLGAPIVDLPETNVPINANLDLTK